MTTPPTPFSIRAARAKTDDLTCGYPHTTHDVHEMLDLLERARGLIEVADPESDRWRDKQDAFLRDVVD